MYMQQYITITSQGQITIPVAFRKKFGLNKAQKAIIRADGDKVVIESIADIRSLRGVFASKKHFSREEERRAFEDAMAHEAV